MDNVTPHRAMPEVVVEAGDTFNRRRGYLRDFADPLKGFAGQIAEMALNSVQYMKHILRSGADFTDGSIHKCQIQFIHQLLLPMQ